MNLSHWCAYAWRRNAWPVLHAWHGARWTSVVIDRPVFLLGTQGGGLTLLSRILRRCHEAVSVTGDSRYWSGADEMQNVLAASLPPALSGITHHVPVDSTLPPPRGWVYATDRLLPRYRLGPGAATAQTRDQLIRLLQKCIGRYARGRHVRFVDKSQVFTVKVGYLSALLPDACFVLVTRDPYAMCQRAAHNIFPDDRPVTERLRLAAEHWRNSMVAALADAHLTRTFHILRFETFLQRPTAEVQRLCGAIDLPFDSDMMPQPGQHIPLGTLRRDRWYPIRTDVNEQHLQSMTPAHTAIVHDICGETAQRLGYTPP